MHFATWTTSNFFGRGLRSARDRENPRSINRHVTMGSPINLRPLGSIEQTTSASSMCSAMSPRWWRHDIETRITELRAVSRTLKRLVHACHGDDRPDCPILDDLAAPRGEAKD